MCKEVEKVLMETATECESDKEQTLCRVYMDGNVKASDDFVCVLNKENGDASLFYNTDALSLGMAVKMVTRAFVEAMHQCTEEERAEITDILGDAFIFDKPQEEAHE